jgi:hypothetical protein
MFCLLFFPFLLPFYILRFVFKLVFGLFMLPFIFLIVAGALLVAFFSVVAAVFMPLVPFVLIGLAIWALMRHSRAANVYPN